MRPIATDEVAWCVSVSVGHVREPAKTAEPIDRLEGSLCLVGTGNHVLSGIQLPKERGNCWGLHGQLKDLVSQCCGALRSKKNNNGNSGTAAVDWHCIASDGPVPHTFPP